MCLSRYVGKLCSGCVLDSGHEVLSSSPTQAIFDLVLKCLPPAPPVHPAVIGNLAFARVKIQSLFSQSSAIAQVGLRVPTPLAVRNGLSPASSYPSSRSFACTAHSACLHPCSARWAWPPCSSKWIFISTKCVHCNDINFM